MNQEILHRAFSRMGARLAVNHPSRWQREKVRIDVLRDKEGEYFDVRCNDELLPEVIDVRPELRHLVLMVRDGREKNKFLLGHDERHWFAAAVPGTSVRSVETAIASLRPTEIPNQNVIRQGEWFFVPAQIDAIKEVIYRDEPLSRGAGSKPHRCEEMIRSGGVTVMVSRTSPVGVTLEEFNEMHANAIRNGTEAKFRMMPWQRMTRDAAVYVRGKVRHSDHRTVFLDGWHRVYMNNERFAPHAIQIAFLD